MAKGRAKLRAGRATLLIKTTRKLARPLPRITVDRVHWRAETHTHANAAGALTAWFASACAARQLAVQGIPAG